MSDLSTLAMYMGSTAGINAVAKIQKGGDPVPGMIASGLLFGVFAVVGSLWRMDIFKAIAAVMLLAAVLTGGVAFFGALGKLASGLQSGAKTPVGPGSSSDAGGSTGKGYSGGGGGGGGGGGF